MRLQLLEARVARLRVGEIRVPNEPVHRRERPEVLADLRLLDRHETLELVHLGVGLLGDVR